MAKLAEYKLSGTSHSSFQFSEYYNYEAIFNILCKLRCKVAFKRNAKHYYFDHLKGEKCNENYEDLFLMSLFPPRRKWLKLDPKLRNNKNRLPKTSTERNLISLKLTVKYYKKREPTSEFLKKLDDYIASICKQFQSGDILLNKPNVIPVLKKEDNGIKICRPLSIYNLKDKIILSIANKYAVKIFDDVFKDCGYAFRAVREFPEEYRSPNHIDAFKKIIDFKTKHSDKVIWGAECDMCKFFDTVNHSFVIKRFDQFVKQKYFMKYGEEDLRLLRHILKEYLKSYNFNKNVRSLSSNQEYFRNFKIENGRFDWVEKEFLENDFYKHLNKTRIGIPQGGALSGFIANILLHDADCKVIKHLDGNSLYLRFCDDMIILSTDRNTCEKSYGAYINSLTKCKLVVHPHVGPDFKNLAEFWSSKSKLCYKWTSDNTKNTFWVGFVGLEVNYFGDIRIRRSTLKKELKKQADLMLEMKRILKNVKRKSSPSSILGSLQKRMVSMAVGRVDLWNYKSYPNEMSWAKGFKILNDNIHSRRQLKSLDRSRSLKIHKLMKFIEKKYREDQTTKVNNTTHKDDERSFQIKHYGKPYSYYYNTLKE